MLRVVTSRRKMVYLCSLCFLLFSSFAGFCESAPHLRHSIEQAVAALLPRKPEQLAYLELKYKSQVHRMALGDAEVFFNTEDLFRERGETASRRFR